MFPGVHSRETPDKPAVVMTGSGRVMTYRELDEESARQARYLREVVGLEVGDGVALLSDNRPECLVTYWAAQRSGLYITPINHHLTAGEIAQLLGRCRPRVLLVSSALGDLAREVASLVERVEVLLSFDGEVEGYGRYEDAVDGVSAAPLADQPRGADMLFSSGTTGGIPKGIRPPLPDRQVDEPGDPLVATFGPRYGFGPDSVYLSPAPLYHGGPLRFAVLAQALGGTVVMMEHFDPEQALAAIERFSVTHSQWVPTMFIRMLKLPDEVRLRYDVSSMRAAIHASAPCPVDVKHAMIEWWGPVLEEYYASQEAAGITMISTEEWLRKPGSVGRPVLGEVRICDELGEELPVGEVGTIYFARDHVPFVYHDDPAATSAVQHPDHETWSAPGDLGRVDEDGYLYLTDRKAFMIISGGVNIYPQEAEDLLALHPAVLDVAVIGVPDEDMGEAVKAVVQPAPGSSPGPELASDLVTYLRVRLAGYKLPRSVDFVDALPRTPTGKLAKSKLIAMYRQRAQRPDRVLVAADTADGDRDE